MPVSFEDGRGGRGVGTVRVAQMANSLSKRAPMEVLLHRRIEASGSDRYGLGPFPLQPKILSILESAAMVDESASNCERYLQDLRHEVSVPGERYHETAGAMPASSSQRFLSFSPF